MFGKSLDIHKLNISDIIMCCMDAALDFCWLSLFWYKFGSIWYGIGGFILSMTIGTLTTTGISYLSVFFKKPIDLMDIKTLSFLSGISALVKSLALLLLKLQFGISF